MNRWLFVVVGTDPRALLSARLSSGVWPLRVQTPHRKDFMEGDEVVLYMGKPECSFAGTANIASKTFKISPPQRAQFPESDRSYKGWEYGVRLTGAELLRTPIPVRPLIAKLAIFPRKDCWGAFFQSGVVQLPKGDYHIIFATRSRHDLPVGG